MRIGIDIRLIGKKQTGSEATFFNLVKNLALIDDKNEYELFTDITDTRILQDIKVSLGIENRKNFEIISLETKNKFSWNFLTLPKYLRKNPTDIYLTQYITPWFVPRKIKILTIIHDISFNFYPQFIKKTDLLFLKTLIPLSLKRADKIIGVSKFTRDEIVKYYKIDPAKVDYIYNAVSEDFLNQDAPAQKITAVRKKYNLPEKYILYIGTLQPRKNIPTLIEAFALLKNTPVQELGSMNIAKTSFGLKLVVAGGKSHNYDKSIDKVVENAKIGSEVVFPGFIDEKDKAALMAGAEIFVFPSFYEGFGIPILEAMSAGTPVIASNIAPHKEIAGSAAEFFNPNVPGELAQKIREILASEVLKIGLSDKGRVQARKFSWHATAEHMLEIFHNVG